MSYILDALRKAERDRALAQVSAPALLGRPVSRPQRSWVWWVIGATFLLNAGAGLALLLRPPAVGPASPGPAAAPEPATPLDTPATSREVAARSVGTTPVPATPPIAAAAPPRNPPAQPRPEIPAGGASGGSRPAADPAKPSIVETPQPRSEARARTTPERADGGTGSAPAAASVEPSPAAEPKALAAPRRVAPSRPKAAPVEPTPSVAEPSLPRVGAARSAPPTQRPMPESPRSPGKPAGPGPAGLEGAPTGLRLEALVYSETARERLVFINGRKYVEGQQLGDGTLVERITEQGAILSVAGRHFLLSAAGVGKAP